jgi:hypothetical protein
MRDKGWNPGMDEKFWIGELGRLYKRSTEAISQEQWKAIEPLCEEFNEGLSKLKCHRPDIEIVAGTDPIDAYCNSSSGTDDFFTGGGSVRRKQALHEIRSRCEKMANAIGYELPESESDSQQPDRMVMISVDSRQENTQTVNQQVSVKSIQNTIQALPRASGEKEELQELLGEFESEVDGGRDETKLRRILSKANDISTDVTAQMAALALKRGVTEILAL